MDTKKTAIKTLNKQGRGTSVFINGKERLHIEVAKGEMLIVDRSIPRKIIIMSIETFAKEKRENA